MDDVGMYGFISYTMPRNSEMAEIPGTTMKEPDAFGVDHVEGLLRGILDAELLPRQRLVDVTGRRWRGRVEFYPGIRVVRKGRVG